MNKQHILIPLFASLYLALTACQEEKSNRVQLTEQKVALLEKEVSELEEEQARLDQIYSETLQRIKQLEKVRELAEQREAQRLTDDKIDIDFIYQKRLRFIKAEELLTWQYYIGKKYPEIHLMDGTTYKAATITNVDSKGIGFSHTIGAARIAYDKISPEHKQLIKDCKTIPTKQRADLENYIVEETQARRELPSKARQPLKRPLLE